MSLPNPGMVFVPFDILTAAELNDVVENVEALADGTGLDDDVVTDAKLDYPRFWQEIGRTTLVGTATSITVSSLPARKYLKIIITTSTASGTVVDLLTFNGDTGANYCQRQSTNGGADTAVTSANNLSLAGAAVAAPAVSVVEVFPNNASTEKLINYSWLTRSTAGAANIPARREAVAKWTNTAAQISSVTVAENSANSYAIGSEVIVLGHN